MMMLAIVVLLLLHLFLLIQRLFIHELLAHLQTPLARWLSFARAACLFIMWSGQTYVLSYFFQSGRGCYNLQCGWVTIDGRVRM